MGRNQRDETLEIVNSSGTSGISVASPHFSENGTETITISNVGPSGVGTATIAKWLVVRGSADNVLYYIPCWT